MAAPISSRELSLRTWGNDGTGEGRRRRVYERAQDRRSDVLAKRRREAALRPDQIVSLSVAICIDLQTITARQMRTGDREATRADRILSRTVKGGSPSVIAIAPNAEDAAFLAAWLRGPAAAAARDALSALTRLDAIAARTEPRSA